MRPPFSTGSTGCLPFFVHLYRLLYWWMFFLAPFGKINDENLEWSFLIRPVEMGVLVTYLPLNTCQPYGVYKQMLQGREVALKDRVKKGDALAPADRNFGAYREVGSCNSVRSKWKKPLQINWSGFFAVVARRGIEPLLPEWKSGVLTPRRTGLVAVLRCKDTGCLIICK